MTGKDSSPAGRDIRSLRGIGEKRAKALNRLGIETVGDLVNLFPRRYEDRRETKPIALVQDGEAVCVTAVIAEEPRLSRIRRGLEIVRFRAYDDSGEMRVSFFNQSYVRGQLKRGDCCRFYGRFEVKGNVRSVTNPLFEEETAAPGALSATGRIVPVYPSAAGLTQQVLRQSVRQALDACRGALEETLPEELRRREGFPAVPLCYETIHFPEDPALLSKARQRFVFEELFVLSCALGQRRPGTEAGVLLHEPDFERFYASLPFPPTGAQRRAVGDAARELSSGRRMSRLLQGDVGSGKTLVAAALVYQCWQAGYFSLMMAPTEILAEQHYHTLSGFLTPLGLRVGLLTASVGAAGRRVLAEAVRTGEVDLVVGTHALLNETLRWPRLALAITDEQHRFGVRQRARLSEGGTAPDGEGLPAPHVFVMSATPIPRTLSMVLYGDLNVSVLDELPPGRQRVETFCVDSRYRERLNAFIRKLCGEGRQVFVVCPKVEETDEAEASLFEDASAAVPQNAPRLLSAVEETERMRTELPELRIDCVHGRMKAAEKEAVMDRFVRGETQVLVSTTVVEVGVDVPNAALMLVQNAERFGLSQLHQLRGRVGRGRHQSYCVLVTDAKSEDAKARMKILCETEDGFKIAEEDLRLRGPGELFGSRQHGLPPLHVADLGADTETLLRAKAAAEELLEADPDLSLPEHAALCARVSALADQFTRS